MDDTPHDDITLLDGGMGQELLRHSDAAPTPLWSTQVMIDQPELVVDIHRQYIAAGADVITTNAYSATRCRLGPAGIEDQYEHLQRLSGTLAQQARGDRHDVQIAGCLSPYGWSYRPELAPHFDELWPLYAETARLQAPYVDVILCETMGSVDESLAAATGAATTDKPVWVSMTLHDDHTARLRSNEPLADALAALSGVPVDAVLVNCSTPETFAAAMPELAKSGLRYGAYANGFSHIADEFRPGTVASTLGTRSDLGPSAYADFADSWIDAGATIIGGCCEIQPAHIAELARRLGKRR